MVDYKRFSVSVRNSGRVIATEKRKNDIERKLIKPWEVMVIKADNMNEFFVKLKSTFGENVRNNRRRGNWVISYDRMDLKNEESFHEVPQGYTKPKENKDTKKVEEKVEAATQETVEVESS